jgi:hypothetical protein
LTKESSVTGERVPRELKELNDKMSFKFGMKKIDCYRYIANISKPLIFIPPLKSKKKGQIFDMVTFGIVMIVFVLALGIGIFVQKSIQTALHAVETDTTVLKNEDTLVSGQTSWWDFSFALFFFLLLVIIFGMSLYVGTNPFFMMIYLIILIVVGFLFVGIHNVANTVMQAFPTVFSETSMPYTYFIISKLYYIMVLFFLMCFGALFMKPQGNSTV